MSLSRMCVVFVVGERLYDTCVCVIFVVGECLYDTRACV